MTLKNSTVWLIDTKLALLSPILFLKRVELCELVDIPPNNQKANKTTLNLPANSFPPHQTRPHKPSSLSWKNFGSHKASLLDLKTLSHALVEGGIPSFAPMVLPGLALPGS